MLWRAYLIVGVLVLSLFTLAQYYGWSVVGASEAKAGPGVTRSAYHK